MLNIALPKGRLGNEVYSLLKGAGYSCQGLEKDARKLIFCDEQNGVSYFLVKPSDVPVYVSQGAADLGVAGKDIIDEAGLPCYELADLNLGKCDMCIAAPEGFEDNFTRPLRVATKFKNCAEKYYASIGRPIEIIPLNGSIELAPVLGLSDVIFDIVQTGTTLKENNLKVIKKVFPISARLIANKSAFKFKSQEISQLSKKLLNEVNK